MHRIILKTSKEIINQLGELYRVIRGRESLALLARKTKVAIAMEFLEILKVVIVDVPREKENGKQAPMNFERMDSKLREDETECSERFRFQSFGDLERLLSGFRFPTGKIIVGKGYSTPAEEILLISLTRFTFPNRWSDLKERFPGRKCCLARG